MNIDEFIKEIEKFRDLGFKYVYLQDLSFYQIIEFESGTGLFEKCVILQKK